MRKTLLAVAFFVVSTRSGLGDEPPVQGPEDAACRAQARTEVFTAPNPNHLSLWDLGSQIWHSCMAAYHGAAPTQAVRNSDSKAPALRQEGGSPQPVCTSGVQRITATSKEEAMLNLYSYPSMFGVADNNGYGLKVFAFLKLAGLPFRHEHIMDASAAPRAQLPYIVDGANMVGDSNLIISYLTHHYGLTIDAGLKPGDRDMGHLVTRMLDDLYWVMSYSRWKDERFWPAFRDALRREHPELSDEHLRKAREFNAQRYYYQGIGRYAPEEAYARGTADLQVLANLVPASGFLFGPRPSSFDAAIYGFVANIYFYGIETPLKEFVSSHANLVDHCKAIHGLIG